MKTLALFAVLALAACGSSGGRGGYDEKADAAADLKAALAKAKTERKRVLVEAGGNWCSWCKIMDRYFEDHAALAGLRDRSFVTVKVSVPAGGPVPAALSRYPAPAGYPHLYVLDADGSLVQSQDTSALESGQSYDLEKFTAFLESFGPPR